MNDQTIQSQPKTETNIIEPVLYSIEPIRVEFRDGMLWVSLADGRIIATPLHWYPSLMLADDHERQVYECGTDGIHWPLIDEDLAIEGMLSGYQDRTRRSLNARLNPDKQ